MSFCFCACSRPGPLFTSAVFTASAQPAALVRDTVGRQPPSRQSLTWEEHRGQGRGSGAGGGGLERGRSHAETGPRAREARGEADVRCRAVSRGRARYCKCIEPVARRSFPTQGGMAWVRAVWGHWRVRRCALAAVGYVRPSEAVRHHRLFHGVGTRFRAVKSLYFFLASHLLRSSRAIIHGAGDARDHSRERRRGRFCVAALPPRWRR